MPVEQLREDPSLDRVLFDFLHPLFVRGVALGVRLVGVLRIHGRDEGHLLAVGRPDAVAGPASRSVVSCRASPPARSRTQSCVLPERSLSNRMRRPSGLNRGWRSCLGPPVSCRGGLPSAEATHSVLLTVFSATSAALTTYAIDCPSGLIRGSDTRRMASRSSRVIGRAAACGVDMVSNAPRTVVVNRAAQRMKVPRQWQAEIAYEFGHCNGSTRREPCRIVGPLLYGRGPVAVLGRASDKRGAPNSFSNI